MSRVTLITGATGKTGSYAARFLGERGHAVRAFVHRADERAERLKVAGADIVVGDLLDLDAVARAMQGVSGAYFCYPIAPRLVEATGYFAQAARDQGVAAIVNMSQISARRDAGSNAARQHWISERILDWSGLPTTHLRPTFFAEWLTLFAESIREKGTLALPFGDGRHAPIAAEDQGRVIAAILDHPLPHAGKTYPLFGPVQMTHDEIADELTRVLRKPVHYDPIPIETFSDWMKARGMSDHIIQHLSQVALDYRAGRFAGSNDVVERIGGRPATTVDRFVDQHRHLF